ncbi:MAG: hypothetical protein J6386_16885 [Candidatus Synoicihabitans palmerolidicus]|nr:hypothetical protein [Candidatus Synoicihabitans palmerolidicus]
MNPGGALIGLVVVGLTALQWAIAGWARWRSVDRAARVDSSSNLNPRCLVVIPSKGAAPDLERNLRAHLKQSYFNYRVMVAVESEQDPGLPVLRTLRAEDARLDWVVAGWATEGCQQNHNMIAGIR